MAGNSTETFEVVIIVILIIIIVILATMAADFARRRRDCYTYPSPWCFKDWTCPKEPEGKRNVWDKAIAAGLVGTKENAKCFAAASDGINPTFTGNCPNAWPRVVGPNANKITGNVFNNQT
uniref:Membrane protein n=1 Tax=Pithovirus LCPAC201 TaxID=2506591 RepID=A0A481Z4S5_9VIRU|nr:MAG: membrane protein [Pithovirus LCPAC201]